MPDYVPTTDAGFDTWQESVVSTSETHATEWGIPEATISSLRSKQTAWATAYGKASNKQNRTSADVTEKNDALDDYKKIIRGFVQQWLAVNPKVSDSDRTRMGLNIRSGSRTPIPVPDTYPIGTIDFSIRQQHTITFYDQTAAHSNAKPAGVHGCEIFMKADGEAPKNSDELVYLGTCTASPYVVKFDANKIGKTSYYLLRWVNTRGETGPWSTMISAMIVG